MQKETTGEGIRTLWNKRINKEIALAIVGIRQRKEINWRTNSFVQERDYRCTEIVWNRKIIMEEKCRWKSEKILDGHKCYYWRTKGNTNIIRVKSENDDGGIKKSIRDCLLRELNQIQRTLTGKKWYGTEYGSYERRAWISKRRDT